MPLQVVKGINYDIFTPECMEGFRHETWFDVKPGKSTQKAPEILQSGLGLAMPRLFCFIYCVQPHGYWPYFVEVAQ